MKEDKIYQRIVLNKWVNLIDSNNKKSLFISSTISELYIAKKATMKKLKKFFQMERFDAI